MLISTASCWEWSSPPCRHGGLRSRAGQRQLHICRSSAAAPATTRCKLGSDIPVELRRWMVGDSQFVLVLPNIDAVMDMYLAANQGDRDVYWCEPWPSALALGQELLLRPHLVAGRRVAELGCGLGLAGLVAATAGAAQVLLLDREPLALQCALLNAEINGIPASVAGSRHAGDGGGSTGSGSGSGNSEQGGPGAVEPISLQQLLPYLQAADLELLEEQRHYIQGRQQRWEQQPEQRHRQEQQQQQQEQEGVTQRALQNSSPTSAGTASSGIDRAAGEGNVPGVVTAQLFDWSQPVTVGRSDVLLLADCLYEAYSVQPVAEVAPKLLKPLGSRLLLADPPDRARHNRECFLDFLCEESGEFMVEEAEERRVRVWEGSTADWRQAPMALMQLRRATPGDTVGVKLGRR